MAKNMFYRKNKTLFFLVLFILIIFPLGQLSRIPFFWPEARIYLHDIIIIFLLLCWFFERGKNFSNFFKEIFAKNLAKPIIGFFLIGILSLVINFFRYPISELFIGSLYLWRWIAYAGIYFIVSGFSKKQKEKTVDYLIFAGTASAFFGLLQYIFYPDAWPLAAGQWDPHVGRVIGTFLDPGYTGLIYVFTLLLLVNKIWLSNKKLRINLLSGLLVLVYLAFLLTYSRSCYLAFIAAAGVFSYLKKSWKFFLVILAVFLISVFLLPRPHGEGTKLERKSTIFSRIENYKQSWSIIKEKPIFGVGFNMYRYKQRDLGFLDDKWQLTHSGAGADNSFLFVWAATGIAGFGIYLWLWGKAILLKMNKRLPTKGLIIITSIFSLLVHSFFNNSLFYSWIMIWMWVILGSLE